MLVAGAALTASAPVEAAKPPAKAGKIAAKGGKAGKTGKGAAAEAAPAAAPQKVLPPETVEKLRDQLQSEQEAIAMEAAKQLGASGASNASAPLLELLAVGGRPTVTAAALDALARLKDPKGLELLDLYAGNRNPDVRRRAVRALAAIPDPRVVDTLIDRLGDVAPDVRGAAADGLAARGEVKAEARLYALVKRNDQAAGVAGALGSVATPDTVARLADLQGRVDDGVLATALGEYLKRETVPDTLRVEVVRTLAKLPGAATTTALIEYLATVPEKEDRPSRTEAQKVIDQRGGQK